MLAFGLVGYGEHVRTSILPALRLVKGVRIAAVCDPFLEEPHDLPDGATSFTSFESMIATCDLDAVFVGATPDVNFDVIHNCHSIDLPVFVEKPLCTSSRKGRALLALIDNGLILGVGHNFSHAPVFLEVARRFKEVEAFPLLAGSLEYTSAKPVGDRWDLSDPLRAMLLTNATHALDLLLMFDDSLLVKHASCSTSGGRIAISVNLLASTGAVVHLFISNGAPHFSLRLRLLGGNGTSAIVDSLRAAEFEFPGQASRSVEVWKASELQSSHYLAGYSQEIALFCRALTNIDSRRQLLAQTRRAVRCAELIDAIIDSISDLYVS